MSLYKMGVVYIWNDSLGHPWLNGQETMVTSQGYFLEFYGLGLMFGYDTDTFAPDGAVYFALPGDLRPKQQPSGEQSVMEQFKLRVPQELEPA